MPEKYRYDQKYPYLVENLKNSDRLGYNIRDTLRDYFRVFFPLQLKPGDLILDIGSCIGSLGHHLKYAGIKTVGIDLNIAAVLAGRMKYGYEKRNQSLVASGSCLPFRNGIFDSVVSQDVFEHLVNEAEAEAVLGEIERVIKPQSQRIFQKITVLEDRVNIDADESHFLKWTTHEWTTFF